MNKLYTEADGVYMDIKVDGKYERRRAETERCPFPLCDHFPRYRPELKDGEMLIDVLSGESFITTEQSPNHNPHLNITYYKGDSHG